MRRISILSGLVLALAACATTKRNPVLDKYPIGVNGHTTVFYYDVHGSTVAELRADMRKLGPKVDGNSFVGETRSPMRWTWRTQAVRGGSSCAISDVMVVVNAQITLPRWTPPAGADSLVVKEWNRFLTALEVHEAGHKDISAKAGKAIIDRLKNISAPCALLGNRANDIASDIVTKQMEEQRVYDATTRHGLTQGTAFGMGQYTVSATDALTLMPSARIGTVRGMLRVPVERAWAALPEAFSSIELTVNAIDSAARVMGDSMTLHGKLGRLSADDVIDCGRPPAGRHADSVAVSLFVTAKLEPTDSLGVWVVNTVQAVAKPVGAAPILCGSRGVIERRLLEAVRSRVGGP
jgi:predicted secreted Zn-dependent protease